MSNHYNPTRRRLLALLLAALLLPVSLARASEDLAEVEARKRDLQQLLNDALTSGTRDMSDMEKRMREQQEEAERTRQQEGSPDPRDARTQLDPQRTPTYRGASFAGTTRSTVKDIFYVAGQPINALLVATVGLTSGQILDRAPAAAVNLSIAAIDATKSAATTAYNATKSAVNTAVNATKSAASGAFSAVKKGITSIFKR